ncbi:hypothetical protein TYRP_023011 [Tyrophagus putrescentiae]|nr:hypothetical protein TYRP_023011 [Tyrophagus putrescentiae]
MACPSSKTCPSKTAYLLIQRRMVACLRSQPVICTAWERQLLPLH